MAVVAGCPVVLAVDVTDPGLDVDTEIVAGLVPDDGLLIVAVLHPPAPASLNVRLLLWRQSQRDRRAAELLTGLLPRLRAAGLAGRGVRVLTTSCVPGPGLSAPRRVARVLARLCRDQRAGLLVLAAGPRARTLTERTHRHLLDTAPAGLHIRSVRDYALPDAALV